MESPDEILAEVRANLPSTPRVVDIQCYRFIDSIGDPALRVTVVLGDEADKDDPDWSQLEPIQDTIRQALRQQGIIDFAYLRFVTSGELAAENLAR